MAKMKPDPEERHRDGREHEEGRLERRRRYACCSPSGATLRRTSSVASGREAKRNGTNVVPSPGEMCSVPPGRR